MFQSKTFKNVEKEKNHSIELSVNKRGRKQRRISLLFTK